jgi:hypothetical protein
VQHSPSPRANNQVSISNPLSDSISIDTLNGSSPASHTFVAALMQQGALFLSPQSGWCLGVSWKAAFSAGWKDPFIGFRSSKKGKQAQLSASCQQTGSALCLVFLFGVATASKLFDNSELAHGRSKDCKARIQQSLFVQRLQTSNKSNKMTLGLLDVIRIINSGYQQPDLVAWVRRPQSLVVLFSFSHQQAVEEAKSSLLLGAFLASLNEAGSECAQNAKSSTLPRMLVRSVSMARCERPGF